MARNDKQPARIDPVRSVAPPEPLGFWGDFTTFSPVATVARMSRLMDEFLGEGGRGALQAPPIDLTETEDAYILTAELPGVKKDDIAIECRQGAILVRAEKKEQREEEGERGYRMERRYGVFTRSLQLPENADADSIKASYQDGVLRIEITKKPETKPKTIEIHG